MVGKENSRERGKTRLITNRLRWPNHAGLSARMIESLEDALLLDPVGGKYPVLVLGGRADGGFPVFKLDRDSDLRRQRSSLTEGATIYEFMPMLVASTD